VTMRRFHHSLACTPKTRILRVAFIGGIAALGFAASHYHPAVAEAQTRSAESRAEEDDYLITLSSSGTYTAGTQGNVTLKVAPKHPYKIDTTFPIKFVLGDPPTEKNVTYGKKKLEKGDGTVAEGAAVWNVPFTSTTAGKATIVGKLHFKVCTDKCNTHNIDMSITVDVAAAPAPAPAPRK
jgi:hypothetical protein